MRFIKASIKVSYFEYHEVEAMMDEITKRIVTEKGNRVPTAMLYRLLFQALLSTGARMVTLKKNISLLGIDNFIYGQVGPDK